MFICSEGCISLGGPSFPSRSVRSPINVVSVVPSRRCLLVALCSLTVV